MKLGSAKVRRAVRKDQTLQLSLLYSGDLGENPAAYNKAYAKALRAMAAAIERTEDAFVDPEVVVWMHERGKITAEAILAPIK